MADDEWELLTVRGLAGRDERAAEFIGTFVVHREGSAEPVENITVRVKRSVLEEILATLQRVLTRSTPFQSPPR